MDANAYTYDRKTNEHIINFSTFVFEMGLDMLRNVNKRPIEIVFHTVFFQTTNEIRLAFSC